MENQTFTILLTIAGVIATAIGGLIWRLVDRIDRNEHNLSEHKLTVAADYVRRTELKEMFSSFRAEIKEDFLELKNSVRELLDRKVDR